MTLLSKKSIPYQYLFKTAFKGKFECSHEVPKQFVVEQVWEAGCCSLKQDSHGGRSSLIQQRQEELTHLQDFLLHLGGSGKGYQRTLFCSL